MLEHFCDWKYNSSNEYIYGAMSTEHTGKHVSNVWIDVK